MATKFETWAVLDTGQEVHYFEPKYHEEWQKVPNTTYIKFQEPVTEE
jgi:hypothetical protein